MHTLVIVSHPYFQRSTVIKALQQAAESEPQVTVRNLDAIYGTRIDSFDVVAEQQAVEGADRIVFLFPVHWFNLTPMLKAYLNETWTNGWAFGPGAHVLTGKQLLVVASAGASDFTYSADGIIRSSMDAVLTPMKASALYVGLDYLEPLAFYGAMGVNDDVLSTIRQAFIERLRS